MALEALLPSEIARLIYGYLIDEKCLETAKLFLIESSNLQECRSVLSRGRHFTTRVCGFRLMDILEKFCILNSLVQDKLKKINNLDPVKPSKDLVSQIKFLLEESKCEHCIPNIQKTLLHVSSASVCEKPLICSKDKNKINQVEKEFNKCSLNQIQINFNSNDNNGAVEATPLKNLPGYVFDSQNKECDKDDFKSSKNIREKLEAADVSLHELNVKENKVLEIQRENKITSLQRHNGSKDKIETNIVENELKRFLYTDTQTTDAAFHDRLDTNIMTDDNKNKNINCEMQTSDIQSPRTENTNSEALEEKINCIELLGDLTLEILNRTEIQERIADNINKVLTPIKTSILEKSLHETSETTNKTFLVEFNKAVESAVNKTESDPEFIELLNAIIPPRKECLSTEDEMDVITDDDQNIQEKIDSVSKEKNTDGSFNKDILVSGINNQLSRENLEIQNKFVKTHSIKECKTLISSTKNVSNVILLEQEDLMKDIDMISTNVAVNIKDNNISLLNSLESPIMQQKSVNETVNIFSNNTITSTPIKPCAAVQNFDTCEWFSIQDLPTAGIVNQTENVNSLLKRNVPIIYNATETIVNPTPFLSPIAFKETCSVAEKVTSTCNSINMIKDETLHTPDIVLPSRTTFPNNGTVVPLVTTTPKELFIDCCVVGDERVTIVSQLCQVLENNVTDSKMENVFCISKNITLLDKNDNLPQMKENETDPRCLKDTVINDPNVKLQDDSNCCNKKKKKETIKRETITKEKTSENNHPRKESQDDKTRGFPKKSKNDKLQRNYEEKKNIKNSLQLPMKNESEKRVDSLEIILSDNISQDKNANENNIMKLATEEMNQINSCKIGIKKNINGIDKNKSDDLAEKMRQDEATMMAVFQTVARNITDTYTTDSEKPFEQQGDIKLTENTIDYRKIEQELSVITDTNISSPSHHNQKIEATLYDRVSKVESGKIIQKKYARLKTLDTKICKNSLLQKRQKSPLNKLDLDLGSPVKYETMLQIPPTPVSLSPSSSILTTYSKLGEDSRTIQSIMSLDRPLTPKIILTPVKTNQEKTKAIVQKLAPTSYAESFDASNKFEIEQFEVVKENLKTNPQSEKEKVNSENLTNSMEYRDNIIVLKSENSDSSCCSSSCDCACSSSSFSSSSSSSPSTATASTSPFHSSLNNTINHLDAAIVNKIENEEIEKKKEMSPQKVFSIEKTDKEMQDSMKETPAKEDNGVIEEGIHDTPNISKLSEIPPNLNKKFSEIIIHKEQEEVEKLQSKPQVKIINIQRILPKVILKPICKNLHSKVESSGESSTTAKINFEKSEAEIMMAVKSITIESQEKLELTPETKKDINKSIEIVEVNENFNVIDKTDNTNDIIEQIKAIESISNISQSKETEAESTVDKCSYQTNLDTVFNANVNKDKSKENLESSSETENNQSISRCNHSHNTRFQSQKKSSNDFTIINGLSDSNSICKEIYVAFDKDNHKRKKRQHFSTQDLSCLFFDDNGDLLDSITPTDLDAIFEEKPVRKKRTYKTKILNKETTERNDDSSQESLTSNTNKTVSSFTGDTNKSAVKDTSKIINKRKRGTADNEIATVGRKRKKNMYIL